MCNAVLTAGGTVRVKELEVLIAHAIACRGRGFPYITGVNCRRQLPVV